MIILPKRRAVSEASREQAMCANSFNAALDEVARLNRRAIPLELLERISNLFPDDLSDDGSGQAGWLPHVRDTVSELRALLGKEGE